MHDARHWIKGCCARGSGVLLGVLLCGCAVGPNYHTPAIETPQAYQQLPDSRASVPLSEPLPAQSDLSQWWTQFHDPTLDSLVSRALAANLDLQAAAARLRQAREQIIIAGARELPSIDASGLGARLHAGTNPLESLSGGGAAAGAGAAASSAAAGPVSFKLFSLGFDASWELDIFGGVRRSIEAAHASAQAAAWQLRDGEVSLCAEVANDYLTLRAAQAREAILRSSIEHQQQLLQLAMARARAGLTTELDVNQQRAQLATDQAQLPDLQSQALAMAHALGVLLGEEPEALTGELATARPLPVVPPTLPVGLPSQLLRRRPDVREAERQLAAATAQIGVAVAQLYPSFDLIAGPSLVNNSLSGLLSSRHYGDVEAGLIQWPLFDWGRRRANVRAQEDQRQQAYLAYRRAVLAALQDAEDALTRYASAQRRLLALEQARSSAQSSLQIAEQQYQAGTVDFLNVLTATATLLGIEDQTAQSQQALTQALVAVYKALGGGWSAGPGGRSQRAAVP
ncbi:MAG TPA: efflux transporter outer membrane subunit [Steroidobacteraceae bacterium]|nr:efflux transporter outer membrane subunit [Steroidobacteraceae bacterium]